MKKETIFLRLAVFVIGTIIIATAGIVMYEIFTNPVKPDYAYIIYPIVSGMFLSTIPFYIALYNTYKLLCYIDKSIAFSILSVKALKVIKYCAVLFAVIYVIIEPFVYLLAEKDDAPGLIIIAMVPIFASAVIAVFAAILQKLLQQAIDLKEENELTV